MTSLLPQTVPLLILFWLALSGHYTALLLALGALSIALVCWLTARAGLVDLSLLSGRYLFRLPAYVGWLAGQVLISALTVARLAWSGRITVRPVVESTPLPPMSALGQVIYANSITLTPGTLALDVYDDRIEVHSLQAASMPALRAGGMADRVRRLGAAR